MGRPTARDILDLLDRPAATDRRFVRNQAGRRLAALSAGVLWVALRLRGRKRQTPTESDVGDLFDFPYCIGRNSIEDAALVS